MKTRSVVMVAYFFPPEGNAGVYRPLRFLKELVRKGWHATVISCEPYQYERYDPALLTQIPKDTEVVRVKGRDLWRAFQTWRGTRVGQKLASSSPEEARQLVARHHSSWRSKLREAVRIAEAWVYRPDSAMPWIRPVSKQIGHACRRHRANIIWATIGPLSAGVAAYRASLATNVPYVLDFRDPWGLEYYKEEARRPGWAKKVDREIMCRMFERAQAVVFLFESIAQCYVQAFGQALDRNKIHIIPNGFEGAVEDFVHAPGDRCKVLYAGTLNSYRYDTLLEGLVQLKRKNQQLASRLELLFVGEGLQELTDRAAELGLADQVHSSPPTAHAEIRGLQQSAHALLVLGRTLGRKRHELVAGAKLFGYLQAGRPIIGVVPEDETRRILEQVGNSLIANADSPIEVMAALEQVLLAWSSRTLERLVPNRAVCEAYSSSRQISALIAALDGAPAEKGLPSESTIVPPSLQYELVR